MSSERQNEPGKIWDDLVVGAGSAGAVLAARLSEQAGREVLLLEAGPDFPNLDELPLELKDARSAVTSGYNWDFVANVQAGGVVRNLLQSAGVLAASGPRNLIAAARATAKSARLATPLQQQPYFPGKLVGGTSAVNGAVALRAHAEDFRSWAALGNAEWDFPDVLPYYRKLEHDRDFDGPLHGNEGPIPIQRPEDRELQQLQAAFRSACLGTAFTELADLNASSTAGVGRVPSNSIRHLRISTAAAYLAPARSRPNLTIRPDVTVSRVLTEHGRAVGVELALGRAREPVFARRVTLCAGTFGSAPILMRSGIAGSALCSRLDVPCVADLPGVGENLIEHPTVMLWMVPKPGVCKLGEPYHQVLARCSSGQADTADLYLFMLSSMVTGKLPLLRDLLRCELAGAISVMLCQPDSRGRVSIQSLDPTCPPVIELNLLATPSDVQRLLHGVRTAWKIARAPALASQLDSIFMWNEAMLANDELLQRAVSRFVNGSWHAVGTAKMGPVHDRTAVVDQRCRVHGIDNLRVVDASVMPNIPSVPTGLTCVMLGERVADWMSAETS